MTEDEFRDFFVKQFQVFFSTLAERIHEFSPVSAMVVIETEYQKYAVLSYPPSKALAKGLSNEAFDALWGDSEEVEGGEEEEEEEPEEEEKNLSVGVEEGSARRWLRKRAKMN